jgi:hypothetical protein
MNCNRLNWKRSARTLFITIALFASASLYAGDWTITTSAGKSITNWHGQSAVQTVTVGYIPWHWRGFDLGVGAAPFFVRQPKSWFSDDYGDGNETIVGPSIRLMASRSWRHNATVQPYAEFAGGPLWTPKQVPDSTSQMNWVTDFGGGVTIGTPGAHTALIAGYRFSHISNGGLSSRNPGWNVSCVVVGMRIR